MPLELVNKLQAIVGTSYRIESEMTGGGMSRVFLAHEAALKRDVVIKVLPPDLVTTESLVRFRREVELTAQLQHPHILPVITAGGEHELLYYIAPFIRGESLRERLASGAALDRDEAGRLVGELLDAVAFAHARGVIHRDIKPANVLLSDGHAILADFGIARALANPDDDQVTYSGTVIGTPVYMAPERPRDEHADLYAVAVIAFEMLTGSAPPQDRSVERIVPAITAALPRIQSVRANRIARVVAKALSRDPSSRFQSAREFHSAVHHALEAVSPARRVRNAIVLLAVAAVAVFATRQVVSERAVVARRASLGRIVVAPLQNFTGVDSLGVVGMMAGDWVTEGLEKTGIVEVVPTTSAVSAFQFARPVAAASGALVSPKVIAEETGAVTVVYGGLYLIRGRLEFRITVADQRGSRVVGTITDVTAPTSDPIAGVNEARARVMGWLASRYDDRLGAFAASDVRPPTYDAYLAFGEAMDHYTSTDFTRALPLFVRAARLDSSFVTAPLYASICMTNLGQWVSADSLLSVVKRHRSSLNPYHQAWLDYRFAFVHGDRDGALAAIRIAATLAPESKAAYNHAATAYQTGHLTEALQSIEAIHPDRGAMRGFADYWNLYGMILHALGRYEREQEVGALARRAYPDRLAVLTPYSRSLAATGKLPELERATNDLNTLRPDPQYWDQGHYLVEIGEELRAHGYSAEGAHYLERARVWLEQTGASKRRLVQVLYSLQRWDEVRATLAPLRRADPGDAELLATAGLVAAHAPDRAQALAIADTLGRLHDPYHHGTANAFRARISAVLGDREGAVARLREAIAEGLPYGLQLHRDTDLQSLHGYRAFEQLALGER